MAKIIQALTFNLAAPIDATQTSIPVRNLKDSRGTPITSLAGTTVFATIEPRSNSNQEIISFTGITNNGNGIVTLTGVTRNLNPQEPYTTLGGLVPHGNNAECILSNNPPFYNDFLRADANVVITGSYQFPAPTIPANPATKAYVDAIAFSGAPDATSIAKGVVRLTTSPNVTLGNPTITIANPAVVTLNTHGLTENDSVIFTTTGALPTGILPSVPYYVISTGLTANEFQISASIGGAAVVTSGSQSGTHTLVRTTPRAVSDTDPRIPTADQSAALVGAGAAPTGANKFLTQGDVPSNTLFPIPVVKVRTLTNVFGNSTSQFDITNPAGSTYRYTWDATGTDPVINATTVPIGTEIYVNGQNFAAGNNGAFVVTGSGVNYFEVTNASGVVESNRTLGTGSINYCYIKPAGLKAVLVKVQGGGGGGAGTNSGSQYSGGGGAGAYTEGFFAASALGTFERIIVGIAGTAGGVGGAGVAGGNSIFGTTPLLQANGGGGGAVGGGGGAGGTVPTAGYLSVVGQNGMTMQSTASGNRLLPPSAESFLSTPSAYTTTSCVDCNQYGAQGSGYGFGGAMAGIDSQPSGIGGQAGGQGVIIIIEFFS